MWPIYNVPSIPSHHLDSTLSFWHVIRTLLEIINLWFGQYILHRLVWTPPELNAEYQRIELVYIQIVRTGLPLGHADEFNLKGQPPVQASLVMLPVVEIQWNVKVKTKWQTWKNTSGWEGGDALKKMVINKGHVEWLYLHKWPPFRQNTIFLRPYSYWFE